MLIRKQATLEKFEGKQAILTLENGQSLAILKEELGRDIKEGDSFTIQITTTTESELDKEELARCLLNQILGENEKKTPN